PLRAVVPTQVPPPSLTNPSRRFGRWNHSASPKSGGLTTPKTPVRSAHHQLPGAEQQLSRTQLRRTSFLFGQLRQIPGAHRLIGAHRGQLRALLDEDNAFDP